MSAPRLWNWEERFCDYVARERVRPFSWAQGSCCASFVAGGIEALTGEIVLPAFGAWSNEAEARAALAAAGGYEEVFPVLFGDIAPSQAWRGDIGLLENEQGEITPGLFDGETVLVRGPEGLSPLKRVRVFRAFRV